MDCPNHAEPPSGRVLPVMTSIMVVLPAPFGPMMQRNSPGSICNVSSLSALKPSKLTVKRSRRKVLPLALILLMAPDYPLELGDAASLHVYSPCRTRVR